MAVSVNNARLLFLTARKSDLEYKMTMMINNIQQLANQSAAVLEEKYTAVQNYVTKQTVAGTADAPPTVSMNANPNYLTDFDVQLAEIEAAQSRLDLEQKKLETQHKAVTAEEESVQKTLDNSIKEEFTRFQSN